MSLLKKLKIHLPQWITAMFPEAVWLLPTGKKTVYLTFDDGPIPEVTNEVLEILDNHNVQGTFFCVGENVQKNPEVFEAIKKAGHTVGNHTFNHIQGIRCSTKHYLQNIEKADRLINSNMFRPPHGLLKRGQYQALLGKYIIVMWDVISCDYDQQLTPETCYNNVMENVRDGSIITFHDSVKAKVNVLNALPRVIVDLKKQGYQFRKIEFPNIKPIKKFKQQEKIQHIKASISKLLKGA